ncbi:MAG: M48 family metalloprotease [Spirochaetota bacterium]
MKNSNIRVPVRSVFFMVLSGSLLFFSSCAVFNTITKATTELGVQTGAISKSKAENINKSAEAVTKSFEDITPEQEYYIGRAVGAVVVSQYKPLDALKVNEYLNYLGQSLALFSERPETFGGYHFLLLDSEEINAFAAPGGLIFISRGLLRCTFNEDGVAAILAHEIGHVIKKHGLQAIKKSRITTALASLAKTTAEAAIGSEEMAQLTAVFEDSIGDIAKTLIDSGYSQIQEKDADLAAVAILKRVGYDPRALIDVLMVMDTRLKPGGSGFGKTHPDPKARIKYITKEVGTGTSAQGSPGEKERRYKEALGNL